MEKFAKKLAINYRVFNYSDGNLFPLKRLNEEFEIIRIAYDILSESVTKNVPIPPSGEWLLDNFYIIEEQVSSINNCLKIKKYKGLPSINGIARVLFLSKELVNYTDGFITKDNIENFFNAYESRKPLLQKEIYELPTMLQIALIEHIKDVAQKIIAGQLQKFKVESLIERTIKEKDATHQIFHRYKNISLSNEATAYIEYLIYLLKGMGEKGKPYLDALEDEIIKVGTTSSEAVRAEHYDMAIRRISISNSILSIKNIMRLDWASIFKNINCVEKILSKDKVYQNLDFDTKELYRNQISSIARKARVSEIYIANQIEKQKSEDTHIGDFLIGDKTDVLLESIGYKRKMRGHS